MKTYDALFIGVDVGTGSARAALVTDTGVILKTATEPIQTWNPVKDHFEQSSENIWNACIIVIKVNTVLTFHNKSLEYLGSSIILIFSECL